MTIATAITIFSILVLAGCAASWVLVALRRSRLSAWHWCRPIDDRPAAVWGLLDLLIIVLLIDLTPLIVQVGFGPAPQASGTVDESPSADDSSLGPSTTDENDSQPSEQSQQQGSSPQSESKPDSEDGAVSDQESPSPENQEPDESAAAPDAGKLTRLMATNAFGQFMGLGLAIAFLVFRWQCRSNELGLVPDRFLDDIKLGLFVSLMVLPPVLLLQQFLVQFFPYSHTTITRINETGSLSVFLAAVLSAGIAAPVVEEFTYRLFIQGWLRRFVSTFVGAMRLTPQSVDASIQSNKGTDDATSAKLLFLGGRESDKSTEMRKEQQPANDVKASPHSGLLTMIVPVLLVSLLFASRHIGQGPAPIPLFFLAVALGILFHLSQRILPCIVVHLVLNMWTLTLLGLSFLFPELTQAS